MFEKNNRLINEWHFAMINCFGKPRQNYELAQLPSAKLAFLRKTTVKKKKKKVNKPRFNISGML